MNTTVINKGSILPNSHIIRCKDLQSSNEIPTIKIIGNDIVYVRGGLETKKLINLKSWTVFSEEVSTSNFWLDSGKIKRITDDSLKINGFLGVSLDIPKSSVNIVNGNRITVCPLISASYTLGDYNSDYVSDYDNGFFTTTDVSVPIQEGWRVDVISNNGNTLLYSTVITKVVDILSGRKLKLQHNESNISAGSCTLRIHLPVYLIDSSTLWVEYFGIDWLELPTSITVCINDSFYYWRVTDKIVPNSGYMLSIIKLEFEPTVFIGNAFILWRKVGTTDWQPMGNFKIDTGTILCPAGEIEIKNPHSFSVKVSTVLAT